MDHFSIHPTRGLLALDAGGSSGADYDTLSDVGSDNVYEVVVQAALVSDPNSH